MAQLLLSVIVDYFSIMKNSSAFVLFTLKMTCFFIIRLAIKKAMCCHLCLVQIVVQIGRDQKWKWYRVYGYFAVLHTSVSIE